MLADWAIRWCFQIDQIDLVAYHIICVKFTNDHHHTYVRKSLSNSLFTIWSKTAILSVVLWAITTAGYQPYIKYSCIYGASNEYDILAKREIFFHFATRNSSNENDQTRISCHLHTSVDQASCCHQNLDHVTITWQRRSGISYRDFRRDSGNGRCWISSKRRSPGSVISRSCSTSNRSTNCLCEVHSVHTRCCISI